MYKLFKTKVLIELEKLPLKYWWKILIKFILFAICNIAFYNYQIIINLFTWHNYFFCFFLGSYFLIYYNVIEYKTLRIVWEKFWKINIDGLINNNNNDTIDKRVDYLLEQNNLGMKRTCEYLNISQKEYNEFKEILVENNIIIKNKENNNKLELNKNLHNKSDLYKSLINILYPIKNDNIFNYC